MKYTGSTTDWYTLMRMAGSMPVMKLRMSLGQKSSEQIQVPEAEPGAPSG